MKRSRVFETIPIITDEKKQKEPDYYDRKWEMQFFELKKFKKKHGHCDVSRTYRNKTLGNWCVRQRRLMKFNPLKYSPEKLRNLNELGFGWSPVEKIFENKYHQLKQYQEKHKHCNVKESENLSLSRWCTSLRRQRKTKASRLTKERIQRLTSLGFLWYDITKNKNELLWAKQFMQLKRYKKKHGHCNVSFSLLNNPDANLIRWIVTQRMLYRTTNSRLTVDRIAKLNKIGFNWINPTKMGDARRLNDTDLLNELKRLYLLRGKSPSAIFIDKHGKYTQKAYYNHFGNIKNARKKAGIR